MTNKKQAANTRKLNEKSQKQLKRKVPDKVDDFREPPKPSLESLMKQSGKKK